MSVGDEYGEVYEWEGLFQDRMKTKAAEIESLNVAYFTGRSMDDSLAESVSGEVFLFGVTCELTLSLPLSLCLPAHGRGPTPSFTRAV